MKFCPMCGMSQPKAGLTACQYCDYKEKPMEAFSKEEIEELMAPYDYERIEGGIRILAVKNNRNTALRGAVGLPHFVTEIGAEAFASCKFLTRVDLPRGLCSIGDRAFAHCRDLFDVFIPAEVSHIGKEAFADCYDLGVIQVAASEQPEGWNKEWLSGCDGNVEWSSTEEE